jgi:heat shock protein HslJ
MRARLIVTVLMAVSLPLAACAASDSGTGGSSAPSLADTTWNLAQYAPVGETTLVAVPDQVLATAAFTADQISGSGGCNTFTGGYTTDGATIEIGPLATTLKACLPLVSDFEAAYLARLDEATSYAISAETLTMSNEAGEMLLSFSQAVPVSLTGSTWLATGINNGTGGVQSLVIDSKVTAIFADDGTISGEAGCNTYSGTYEVDGDAMTIGPLASTMMACADEEVTQQETAYLAALSNVSTYSITGNSLELRDESGALQAGYATE